MSRLVWPVVYGVPFPSAVARDNRVESRARDLMAFHETISSEISQLCAAQTLLDIFTSPDSLSILIRTPFGCNFNDVSLKSRCRLILVLSARNISRRECRAHCNTGNERRQSSDRKEKYAPLRCRRYQRFSVIGPIVCLPRRRWR